MENADGQTESWRVFTAPFNAQTQSGEHLEANIIAIGVSRCDRSTINWWSSCAGPSGGKRPAVTHVDSAILSHLKLPKLSVPKRILIENQLIRHRTNPCGVPPIGACGDQIVLQSDAGTFFEKKGPAKRGVE